ncbi:MAG: CoA-transferase subunit beta [Alphaproteobacteria bacterium]|nr:CoA-transferase subunit beta [Alphaproteobacteria bacterium]
MSEANGHPLTDAERMVVGAARELKDGEICFVGVGVPSLAAMLAKRTHAPELVLIYESGAIATNPPSPPLSTGSPTVIEDCAMIGSCLDVFATLQSGRFDLGLLSAAQIDRYGNLNSTVIGDYRQPKLRLVGSGGAHDIACLAREVMVIMPHDPRRFVERVDFLTSPGLRSDANGIDPGAVRGHGPRCVVTSRARFDFEAGELTLNAVFEGFSADDAVEGFNWSLPRRGWVETLPPFEAAAVAIMRAEIRDPIAARQ